MALPLDASQQERDAAEWLVGTLCALEEKNWMRRQEPGAVFVDLSRGCVRVVYHSGIYDKTVLGDIACAMGVQIDFCHAQFNVRSRFVMSTKGAL